jgi:hypothetical protein
VSQPLLIYVSARSRKSAEMGGRNLALMCCCCFVVEK